MVAVPGMVVQRRLTFEDYKALPDDQDYEIIDGVLYVSPRARPRHQVLVGELTHILIVETERSESGTVVPDADLIVSERDVYIAPDIMYFAGERFQAVDPDGWIRIVPDLIVEVLSPSTEDYDRTTKLRLYEELGAPHYWMVDPRRRMLTEHVLGPAGRYEARTFTTADRFRPALFPHLEIHLASLLQPFDTDPA